MNIKDIDRERLEEITHILLSRVICFEGNRFVDALAADGISLEEADAFGFAYDNDDVIRHKVLSDYYNPGTYHIHFYNDETKSEDVTEFYAKDEERLIDLWYDFCVENDIENNCLIYIEFICNEQI
jgi:hypothetical protein